MVLFFFFKQKTAYEMRISDWSSDVCSSDLGGDDLDARTGAVLAQVGLPADRLDVEVGHLSGGQAARAALAAILLSRQDVLLLDEPTNDLYFAGLDLLESFVASTSRAVVTVSHADRKTVA